MRVTFVLPAPIRIPMGGAAVVYRHAEALAARGHRVSIVSPRRTLPGWRGAAMEAAVQVRDWVQRVAPAEYYAAPGVRSLVVPRVEARHLPEADVVVATGVQTARTVAALPEAAGAKVYFIQGDETFADPSARETWHLPMRRITCASWLAEEIRQSGETVDAVIPNAVDPADFGVDVPIEDRRPSVVALYHRHPVKGPDVLIEALERIRVSSPDVRSTVFSARPPSHALPDGVEVHVRPDDLRGLYNASAVLLHPSRSEGWPLVPMEAAACGCAVVGCANPGVQEYLEPGVSMRAVPVGDGRALGEAALDVLNDAALRQRLAAAAQEVVMRSSWTDSTDVLERALHSVVGKT